MGQVHTSDKVMAEKHIYDDPSSHVRCPHGKIMGTGVTVSSPRKRKIEQLEHLMKTDSKHRRVLCLDREKHLEMSRDNARELVAKFLLNLMAPHQLLCEKPKQENKSLPKLEDNHFRFGEDPADQEFVIYMRLDGCGNLWNVLLEPYKLKSASKIEISIILQCYEEEFFERRIPFEPSPNNIDVKFTVRSNKRNVAEFLKSLSSRIQALIPEEEESGISKPVLQSEEIPFGSLVHTMASLSLCKISDVNGHPESVHNVSCYVFLDVPPLSPKKSPTFCISCSEGSHLMTVFNEVKRSSEKLIDLIGPPQVPATSMELGPFDTNSLIDDDECTEPTDLRINKTAEIATETIETVKSNKQHLPKAEKSKLRKVMTVSPINRKHKGRSRELYLTNKMKLMEKRLLALKKQQLLSADELQGSTGQLGSVDEAEAPSNCVISQPSPPATAAVVPIAVVPAIPYSEHLTVVPTSSSSEENVYKCPENGCKESFNNKSSLGRHRKEVHFPNKHKCDNCGHAFPRSYMLTRHVRDKLCLPKDGSKSTPKILVVS